MADKAPELEGAVPVDRSPLANNATRKDDTEKTISERDKEVRFEGANPTTEAKNTLADAPKNTSAAGNVRTGEDGSDILPGQEPAEKEGEATHAVLGIAPDRVGPGTGDGDDTRPLGDPNAPQGTGREVPGQQTPPAELRPAPAGKVRTSWAAGETDHGIGQ